jgi:glycosyltransferase involved in cell wall biosynthesis
VTRVSIDASAVPADARGAGRYVLDLVAALSRRDDVDLAVVTRADDGGRWPAAHAVAPGRRPLRLAWEQAVLPRTLRRLDVDVHHAPHYTMPERVRLPRVVTVHDLTFFDHPEWHQRVKVPFFRRAIRVASERADAIICPSQATADRLAAVAPARGPVTVIPHGVDHQRFRAEGPVAERPAPYVLFLGTIEPRKDVPTLVRAFDRLAGDHPEVRLVLAGGRGWGWAAAESAIAASRYRARVDVLGFITDDAVPALLRGAAAVVYPSLEEGFGLPALEALACGAPLVTTAGSALEEVAGDAARLVQPGDEEELATAIDRLLTGDPEQPARRARGIARAAAATWEEAARRHVDVYRAAAEGRR